MAQYCTISDVRLLHSPIPADQDSLISAMITKASAYIESYLGRVFTPAPDTEPVIQALTSDLALYYTLRSLYASNTIDFPPWMPEIYERVLATLESISTGFFKVFDKDGNEVQVRLRQIDWTTEDELPTFDMRRPIDWQIRVKEGYLEEDPSATLSNI